jgi:hypothetical protein
LDEESYYSDDAPANDVDATDDSAEALYMPRGLAHSKPPKQKTKKYRKRTSPANINKRPKTAAGTHLNKGPDSARGGGT